MPYLVDAFHTMEKNFFSMVSLEQVDYGNLIAFATGIQAPGLNPAIVQQIDAEFAENLLSCRDFYAEKQLPWALILPEYYYNKDVESMLSRYHFVLNGDNGMAMAIMLEDIQFPSQETPLEIKEIQGNLEEWSIPLIYGFESTPEITSPYAIRHQEAVALGKKLYHFSGFLGKEVVCSLSLSLCGNKARIDDLATMPFHQRAGYASALVFAALKRAKELNARYCFLEASGMGFHLYKKIGFHTLFTNYCYEYVTY
ncbi:GNAT family N-acetyltransferase [Legionella oakridgensis]|uniref:Acetyltransferase n=2 Tax=Legionella oakridgensis TaxID=29423 RepID=W0BAZ7_9GAMM|nr:GNAT family N-acetyltransferase [Legionella oakridgensis]AHE67030.1 acetyltransferase [Legionella oakridgensis ATCC 33761 = DSM 21215]ETO93316.1 acetyltransferase [Legionella oakridgensis RV-2-2007]KTD37181.1 GNAT family acetyltransferase [Legionella oakridgensis]STY20126.1 GNAT family acetyltransferase [Legionella longbeachae]